MKASGTKKGRRHGRSGNKLSRCPGLRPNEVILWARSIRMERCSICFSICGTLFKRYSNFLCCDLRTGLGSVVVVAAGFILVMQNKIFASGEPATYYFLGRFTGSYIGR